MTMIHFESLFYSNCRLSSTSDQQIMDHGKGSTNNMAAENVTRAERYMKEMKSNLETALLTINNLSIQLGGISSSPRTGEAVYTRTSGYVNWSNTHNSIKTKRWKKISDYMYYCACKEEKSINLPLYFGSPGTYTIVNEVTRFPADYVYLNKTNPIVAAEILYIRWCNAPEPGLLRHFINIAKSDSHTRNSFEEKYGLIWVEPCSNAIKHSINNALDAPAEAGKVSETPITSITASESNIKPASEVHEILKEKPDSSECKQTKEPCNTELTKKLPDDISANEPASDPYYIPDFLLQNENKDEAILKQETDRQTCSAETSNAADHVVIKSANTEPNSLLKDDNPTVILDQKQAHASCTPVQVSYPAGVSVLVSKSDKKTILDTILISEKPKDYKDTKLMSYIMLKEKPEAYERDQAMETSETKLTNESTDSFSTVNKSALNPDVAPDLPLLNYNYGETVLKQETKCEIKSVSRTVTVDQKQEEQVFNPVAVSVYISDSGKKTISDICPLHICKNPKDAVDLEQAAGTEITISGKEANAVKTSIILDDSIKMLPAPNLFLLSNDKCPKHLTKEEQPQKLCSIMTLISDQELSTAIISSTENDENLNVIKKQETLPETCNNVTVLESVSVPIDDSIKILSAPNLFLLSNDKCPKHQTKEEQPQELCTIITTEQTLSTAIISTTENDENLNVIKKHESFSETCNKKTDLESVILMQPVNERTTNSVMPLEQEIPDSSKENQKSKDNFFQKNNHGENLVVMENKEQLTETSKNIPDALPKDSNENSDLTLNNEILSEDASQDLYAKFRDILNQLTMLNVNTMVDKIHTLEIKDKRELIGLTDILFDKILEDPDYAKLYADLTRKLSTLTVFYDDNQIESTVSFRSCVYKKCQNLFESRKTDDERGDTNDCSKNEFEATDKEINLLRSKAAANIKFIGELYMVKYMPYMLLTKILGVLINDLDEIDLDNACELLIAVGKQLEYDSRSNIAHIFKKMQGIIDSETNKISENIKRRVQNVIELKQNGWVNKGVIISLPKTMEEFQKEAEARALNIMLMNARGSRTSNDGVTDVTNYSIKALKQHYLTHDTLHYIKLPPICFQNIASKIYNIFEKFRANSRPDHLDYRRGMLADNQDEVYKWEESYLSKTNTRINPNTSNEMFQMSTRQTTYVVKPKSSLTDTQIRMQVRVAIDEYQNHLCDDELVLEVKQIFLDCHHASVINEVVNFALEKVGKEFDLTVKYLLVLIDSETVTPENLESGLLETFQNAPDLFIDIPLVYTLLAKLLAPHIVKNFVTIPKLFELSENLIASNHGNMFLKELVIQLNESIGCSSVARLWRESGLQLSQWMPEEDVEEWIFDNGFDFLDESS